MGNHPTSKSFTNLRNQMEKQWVEGSNWNSAGNTSALPQSSANVAKMREALNSMYDQQESSDRTPFLPQQRTKSLSNLRYALEQQMAEDRQGRVASGFDPGDIPKSASVNNMKRMFETSGYGQPLQFGHAPIARSASGGAAFAGLVALLESGASTLDIDDQRKSALASELAALRHRKPDLDLASLFANPDGNNADLEKRREATRRELEALREARWCMDDDGFSELVRNDNRATSERQRIEMELFVAQILTGLANASSLFMVACGLSLIFGVTRIVNFAHGSLYMLGAYMGYSLMQVLPGELSERTFPAVKAQPIRDGGARA